MRIFFLVILLSLANGSVLALDVAAPAAGVIGVEDAQLDADYWTRRVSRPAKPTLDATAIATQNKRLQELDPSVHDIESMASTLDGTTLREWITTLSAPPDSTLWDSHGVDVGEAALADITGNLALDAVRPTQVIGYGLVIHRADLRRFPTRLRVFDSQGDTDIDRFQESALFPGTPVAIVHESRDGQWWFVASAFYAAWVEKIHVAEGAKDIVFAYTRRSPALIVTGATIQTVFTPEQPEVSQLQLDMGVRVPLLADWPSGQAVNGQSPFAGHVIQLPVRASDGSLRLQPALLPRSADVASDYLTLTPANLLSQSFKFLGERYGWGNAYNARDCSGFVSDVYRSFGVQLPRNTRDQAVSPALNRIAFTEQSDPEQRVAAIRDLQVGDLIYIPGHVMMVIGHARGEPYVIHDTTGMTYRDEKGDLVRVVLNGVSVTPLKPLLFNKSESYVDRMYSILRIRP